MKEVVLIVAPNMESSSKLLQNPLLYKIKTPIKHLIVDDEMTKNMLLNANIITLPIIIVDTGDGHLMIKGVSNILKFLEDIINSETVNKPVKVIDYSRPTDYIREELETIEEDDEDNTSFKPEKYYSTSNSSCVFFIDYISTENYDYNSIDRLNYNLVLSQNSRGNLSDLKDNLFVVSYTDVNLLKDLLRTLNKINNDEKQYKILVISKTKKLPEIVAAMIMYNIEKKDIRFIENLLNIQIKKTHQSLFKTE